MGEAICLEVPASEAEGAIRGLRARGLLDLLHRITRDGRLVYIPVIDPSALSGDPHYSRYRLVPCSPPRAERPGEIRTPSFDLVGDVAIVRRNAVEYLGEEEVVKAIRSYHKKLRAIYVKDETVDEFRRPALRLLWGEEIREVVAKEYGLSFLVRLGEVYYNQRLSEEHRRLASEVGHGELVADLFSGVGGFSIHIASMKYARVIANDLNPVAYECLARNISLNMRKLRGTVIPLNLDAREVGDLAPSPYLFDRVIANLPKHSLRFAELYDRMLRMGGALHLYVLSYDIDSALDDIRAALPGWDIRGRRLVLEYAPRAGIFRVDLVKA